MATSSPDAPQWQLYTTEDWGPATPGEWHERDPLGPLEATDEPLARPAGADASFLAWLRLPRHRRRQVWREREIAAELLRGLEIWQRVPGVHEVGVGVIRSVSRPTLAAIVTSDIWSGGPNWLYDVPDSIDVKSELPGLDQLAVPAVVRRRPRSMNYDGVSNAAFLWSAGAQGHQPILRTGLPIAGASDDSSLTTPGTLAALADGPDGPLLLSAGHVVAGHHVIAELPTPDRIATNSRRNDFLDAGVAQLTTPFAIDLRLPELDLMPAPPVHPWSEMPVQMFGAVSHHRKGFIEQAFSYPVTGYRQNHVSRMKVAIEATQGDSGALLVSGHDALPAAGTAEARFMSRGYVDSLVCSMLGILTTGPNPDAPSTIAPSVNFVSILQVLHAFDARVFTVERRELAA